MNNTRAKGLQNVDRLNAKYKQVTQKRRIECLKRTVHIGSKRKCKAVFLLLFFFWICWNIFPKFRWTKRESSGPLITICFWSTKLNFEANLVLRVCISKARVRVLWNIVGMFVEPFIILYLKRATPKARWC